ncbi:Cullin repeat-like-containing domain protein [Gaertneriomyces semiglobifer]|nr:Cullin repeat-like-containing domain protein [Gaertneriomyces semiglobifer]
MAYVDMFTAAASFPNAGRRDLERKLANATEELLVLQESLQKTNHATESISNMLDGFDLRLGALQSSILPIHKLTSKLTKLHERIQQSLNEVQSIVDYYEIGTKEEPLIAKGPDDDNLDPYLQSVDNLKEALVYLQTTNYKASERSITQLKYALTKALGQLNNLFRRVLTAASTPVDVDLPTGDARQLQPAYSENAFRELEPIPTHILALLQRLTREFQATNNIGGLAFPRVYLKTYEEIRAKYLMRALQPVADAAKDQDQKQIDKVMYSRSTCLLVPYVHRLLEMLKAERELTYKLLPKPDQLPAFQNTVAVAIDAFIEAAETVCGKAQRLALRREYQHTCIIIDVVQGLSLAVMEFEGVLTSAGPKGMSLNDLCKKYKGFIVEALQMLLEDIKNDPTKGSPVAADGTVHELTSRTMNVLRRFADYHDALNDIIAENNTLQTSTFGGYFTAVLLSLQTTIDSKSKGYKHKQTLAWIFLLNNYYYMVKGARGILNVIGDGGSDDAASLIADAVVRLEKLCAVGREGYRDSWKAVIEAVSDKGMPILATTKSLSKSQREAIKEKFKQFNNALEDIVKTQRSYSVPDAELRALLVKDVRAIVMPFYKLFYERNVAYEFSKTPEKYIRYAPQALEEVIDGLFAPGNS